MKKNDIASRIDHSLHNNRTLLRKLADETDGHELWDRHLLVKLGFDFSVFTGLMHNEDGTIAYRIYDFIWEDYDQDQIIIRRSEEFITV